MIKLYIFSAPWCKHCGGIERAIEGLPVDDIIKYNVDDVTDICDDFNIVALPTICILKDDKEVARFVGETLRKEIEDKLIEIKNGNL